VRSYNASGVESADSAVTQSTTATPATINVTASPYNAVGDGSTLNTVAIQNAINACTTGGKVLIPSGKFKSGALYLKGNCTYQIDGSLLGSSSKADYEAGNNRFPIYGTSGFGSVKYADNYKALLNSCGHYTNWSARSGFTPDNMCNTQNIRITGAGSVTGVTSLASAQGTAARGDLVNLTGVNGLYIANLLFSQSPEHMLYVARSSNITIAKINVQSAGISNGDGIDLVTAYATSLSSSGPSGLLPTNAWIFGSTWNNGDDCINLNAGSGAPGVTSATPVNGVHIFNNNTLQGHGGVVLGSFTAAGFKNISVTENTFDGTNIGLRFKTGTGHGGGIAPLGSGDFGFRALDNKVNAISDAAIDITSSYADTTGLPEASMGSFHDLAITNLTGSVASGAYAVRTTSVEGYEDTRLKFSNINIPSGVGASIFGVKGSPTDTLFTSIVTKGSFTYDSSLLSSSNFLNCSPTPVGK
jgi:exo-poly-alpha-galacturonosidase